MGFQSEIRDHLLSQPPSFKKKREYSLEKVLGRGGFGKVVKATWSPPNGEKKEVALKIIPKNVVDDENAVMDEINVLRGLDHPNIVHVWDHFESRDKYYLAFELATGGELFDRISARGKFTEKDGVNCIRQVLSATAYLHSHSIVHRDLKPENILYKTRSPKSPIVIADFGIAKHLETPDEEVTTMAGSFGYAAPEVLRGLGHGLKVDCWSIGVIAYTLLGGYSPFRSEDKEDFIRDVMRGKITFHDRYWKNVSTQAKDFIRALLVIDPIKRLSAREALEHPWMTSNVPADHDLSENIRENFNPRMKWEKAIKIINASNRIRGKSGSPSASSSTAPDPAHLSPTPIPQSITPLSMTDEDTDGRNDYFTASERESLGPATPARSRFAINDPVGDPKEGEKGKVDSPVIADEVGESPPRTVDGREASPTHSAKGVVPKVKGKEGQTGIRGMMGKLGL